MWATSNKDLLPGDTVYVPRLAHHQVQRDGEAEEAILGPSQEMTTQELSERKSYSMPTQDWGRVRTQNSTEVSASFSAENSNGFINLRNLWILRCLYNHFINKSTTRDSETKYCPK